MEVVLCGYCSYEDNFEETVNHVCEKHASEKIKYREKVLCASSGKMVLVSKVINLAPQDIDYEKLHINSTSKTLTLMNISPVKSPAAKRLSLDKEREVSHQPRTLFVEKNLELDTENHASLQDHCSQLLSMEETSSFDSSSEEPRNIGRKEELIKLLPDVISYLVDNNQYGNFLNFAKLLAHRKLPLDNISYNLFMDVVNFYSCKTTQLMRYNPVSKSFWQVGKKLFHSKFINFMCGFKHLGALVEKMD